MVSGANNVTIENVEVINSSPPSGNQDETSDNINNILVANSPNLTVHNATLRDGSSGIYLVNSPGANISHVDGYDFHLRPVLPARPVLSSSTVPATVR